MINYNEASFTYDNTRSSDDIIIDYFNNKISFNESVRILDFGCGTGNYLYKIKERYNCHGYGIEPSDGMREKAIAKNPELDIRKGDHSNISFEDNYFNFIYLTDVIHHIPDLEILFYNLYNKLAANGCICILTESHKQIEKRWYNVYFPSLIKIEKKRYPDIPKIYSYAKKAGFIILEPDIRKDNLNKIVDENFIKMVEEKNYSMFKLLDEIEFNSGLKDMKKDLGKTVSIKGHSETLVWLMKT